MGEWEEIVKGQRIELTVLVSGVSTQFSSVIDDRGGDMLMVAMPSSPKANDLLKPDMTVNATVYSEKWLYKFSTLIKERKVVRGVMLVLNRPGKIDKVPPRSFYRLSVTLPVQYRLMRDEVTPISEFKPAIAQDLSGGGILMEMKTPLSKDTLIEVNIPLPAEKEPVSAIARVGFIKSEKKGRDEISNVGAEFIVIEEKDRDKIIKFILARQRDLKKKGLIR